MCLRMCAHFDTKRCPGGFAGVQISNLQKPRVRHVYFWQNARSPPRVAIKTLIKTLEARIGFGVHCAYVCVAVCTFLHRMMSRGVFCGADFEYAETGGSTCLFLAKCALWSAAPSSAKIHAAIITQSHICLFIGSCKTNPP